MSSGSLSERFSAAAHAGTVARGSRVVADVEWHVRYARWLRWVDAIMIAAATGAAYFMRFGSQLSETVVGTSETYGPVLIIIGSLWWAFLGLRESRGRCIIGHGLEEYRRVITATLYAFGAIAICAFIFQVDLSRAIFLSLLPLGMILLTAGRWLIRQELHRRRSRGSAMTRTVVVGGGQEVADAVQDLNRNRQAGYKPVAVAYGTPTAAADPALPSVRLDDLDHFVSSGRAGAVVVAGGLPRSSIRRLAWKLENSPVELMFVPWLTDVAGPRLTIRQVQDLSLTQVALPKYSGWNHVLKRAFDISFALVAMIILVGCR